MRLTGSLAALLVTAVAPGAPSYAQANAPPPNQPVQAPPSAPAATSPTDGTIHRHLGFFIRPDIGFGYVSSSATSGRTEATYSGGAAFVGVSIGGAVAENLILAGHVYGTGIRDPSLSLSGVSQSTSDVDVTLGGIGPEVSYYFMPANVYVSAAVALTRGSIRNGGQQEDTETGLGLMLGVGKEWWVSDHWALGAGGRFMTSWNKDSSAANAPTWSTWGLGAVFSATYN